MSEPTSRYALDNLNVLVLDDNRHMRGLVQSILHSLGVKISVKQPMRQQLSKSFSIFWQMY
jgi:CheY-like chemotaxis protein